MNKKKIIIVVSILVLVSILAIASSYAIFRFNVTKNANFKLAIGNLELSITDTETEDKYILESTVPTKDEVALEGEGYTFTITNTGTIDSYYTVYLDDILLTDAGDRLDNSLVKMNLLDNKTNKSITKRLTDFVDNQKKLASGYLKKDESITYTLRMWVDYEAGNEAQNKYFATQIRVVGQQNNAVVYEEDILNGATPVLTDNLVPIQIADNGIVTKANIYSEWYSYDDKKWANAVVTRNSYDTLNSKGKVNGATKNDGYVSFDGVDDYIDLGLTNHDFGNTFTMAMSVKFNTLNTSEFLLGNWDGAGCGVIKRVADNTIQAVCALNDTDNYVYITSKSVVETNKYYDIVLTSNGNTISLFINGKLESYYNTEKTLKSSGVPIYIGANPNAGAAASIYANIDVKQVAIFDRSVTQDEVKNSFKKDIHIYNSQNLLAYEDFTERIYLNDEVIPEDSIESYFVWIPKYSYQLWDLGDYSTLTSNDVSKPHAIPIKFGITNTSDSNTGECTTPGVAGSSGNCKVGDYMTHPAFLAFDSTGMWVGKFQTGNSAATSRYDTIQETANINNLVIKPNYYTWKFLNIGNMFNLSYNYLRSDESHMMKNTEWGAMAYLSHSLYGNCTTTKCTDVMVNNNLGMITGYASTVKPTKAYMLNNENVPENRVDSTTLGVDGTYTVNYFNSLSNAASTTGNYTGIYDTSGISWEYGMGYTTSASNLTVSGLTDIYSDFFTNSKWDKYYDKYTATLVNDYNNRILGDATGELGPFAKVLDPDGSYRYQSSWYDDYSAYVRTNYSWFIHSGGWNAGTKAGTFAFSSFTGEGVNYISYRIVLTPKK